MLAYAEICTNMYAKFSAQRNMFVENMRTVVGDMRTLAQWVNVGFEARKWLKKTETFI